MATRFFGYLLFVAALSSPAPQRLIQLNESFATWMTSKEVDDLAQTGAGFMDITDHVELYESLPAAKATSTQFPAQLVHQDYVDSVIPSLVAENIQQSITTLSAYRTRYYTTDTSVQAVEWLMQQYKAAAGTRLGQDISIELFEHSWAQPSLIVSIKGNHPKVAAESVVIGGHIDSINNGALGVAPGADDDASGSATNLEVFRQLIAAGFRPDRTVEFHVYAAEEVGLRGSQAIAEAYQKGQRLVFSMMQLDMVCWPHPQVDGKAEIGLISDYTSANMNSFLKLIIDEYLDIGYADSVCGYGCSDHASFTKVGYDSAFPFEAVFEHRNPYIHTANDVVSICDMQHVVQFARLGVAYIVETAVLP